MASYAIYWVIGMPRCTLDFMLKCHFISIVWGEGFDCIWEGVTPNCPWFLIVTHLISGSFNLPEFFIICFGALRFSRRAGIEHASEYCTGKRSPNRQASIRRACIGYPIPRVCATAMRLVSTMGSRPVILLLRTPLPSSTRWVA